MDGRVSTSNAAFTGERLQTWAIAAGFLMAAGFAGLVTATGHPILISLVVGAILGILLLNAAPVAVWMVLIGTLVISGPLFMHVPQVIKVGWLFSLLGFFLLAVASLYPALGTQKQAGRPPGFIVTSIIFVIVAVGSTVWSQGGMDEGITAIKRYFQYWGLMYLLAVYPFKVSTVRQWVGLLGIVALLHVPLALYQRLVIVPAWEYMNGVRGFVALDIVVGMFEGTIGGGGSSSVLAYSCLLTMAFVLCAYREGMTSLATTTLALVVCLFPLALGETKVAVIWLPLVLLAINLDVWKKHPVAFVLGLLIALVGAVILVWVYLTLQATDGRSLTVSERFAETIAYNFGSTGYFGGKGLNRTTALTYWWQHHGLNNPVATMFGHGLGSSYGAGERVPITGHMHDAHRGQGIGLSGASAILWDMGLAGLLLFYAVIAGATRSASRLVRNANPGFDRALCKTLLASMVMIWIWPFYNDLILQTPSLQVLMALTLGLIAWRSRTREFPRTATAPKAAGSHFEAVRGGAWSPSNPMVVTPRPMKRHPDGGLARSMPSRATAPAGARAEPWIQFRVDE